MRCVVVYTDPEKPLEEREIPNGVNPISFAREAIGDWTDMTKVIYREKLCHMCVDDLGHQKMLPINHRATEFYLLACRPNTRHHIRGTAVIFEGMLP